MAKTQIKEINFMDGMIDRLENDVEDLEKDEISIKNTENDEKVPNKILKSFDKWEKYMKEYDLELKEDTINNMKEEDDNIQNRI